MNTDDIWSTGSTWRRWNPHIHAPGTTQNDQYGQDAWPAFLGAIEGALPVVEVLGVTDYCTLASYKRALEYRKSGRLPNVEMIFPNIELRLNLRADKGKPTNIHLLFSPDDPDHIKQIEKVLTQLTFEFCEQSYLCTDEDLVRLGRVFTRNSALESEAALRAGIRQFKVSAGDLSKVAKEKWFRENCLIAIPNGNDGLGAIHDDSFAASRQELARLIAPL
jgi:hypothetical protein